MEEKLNKIELELNELKKELNKDYKIGDIVKYCNYDWYIIDIINNNLKLMSKDIVYICSYSDNNSNDYVDSNVKKYLAEFINNLNKDELITMTTNYDENKYYSTKIRIPTLREIERLPMNIRNCRNYYWTMTSSYSVSEDCGHARVFYVSNDGQLSNNDVYSTNPGVRPVITISTETLSNLGGTDE